MSSAIWERCANAMLTPSRCAKEVKHFSARLRASAVGIVITPSIKTDWTKRDTRDDKNHRDFG